MSPALRCGSGSSYVTSLPRLALPRGERRRASSLTLQAAPVLVVVLMAFPSASATHPNLTITAPFKHGSAYNWFTGTTLGCGSGGVVQPRWAPATGNGTMGAQSSASWPCSRSTYVSQAIHADALEVYFPLGFAVGGKHTLSVTWNVRISGHVNFTFGHCTLRYTTQPPVSFSGCSQFVAAVFLPENSISDSVNGTEIYPTTGWPGVSDISYLDNYSVCYPTRCYNNTYPVNLVNSSFAFELNATETFVYGGFLAHHQYWLVTGFYIETDASFDAQNAILSTGHHGSAGIDLSKGGRGITLRSINIH